MLTKTKIVFRRKPWLPATEYCYEVIKLVGRVTPEVGNQYTTKQVQNFINERNTTVEIVK